MVSGAGGAFAYRRRDLSNLLELSSLFMAFYNLFVSFYHFPDHHCAPTLILFLVVGDLLTTYPRISFILWSSKLVVDDKLCSALGLVRSHVSRSASSKEFGSYRSPACRSMEPRYFACLVDHLSHRKASLEPVVMPTAEGFPRFHQASFFTLYKCYDNALTLTATRDQSLRSISPPPPTSLRQLFIVQAIGKLGFLLMGLSLFGPLCLYAWPIFGTDGPTSSPTRSMSILFSGSFISLVLLRRHKTNLGQRLLPRLESISVQELSDYQSTDMKFHLSKLMYLEVFSLTLVWLNVGVRVNVVVSVPPRPSQALTSSPTGFVWFTVSKFSFKKSLQIFSFWERSHPLSSLIGERIFPPISLSMGGKFLSISSASNLENRTTLLTVLLSLICPGPEVTTSFISIRLGGRGFILTSQVKVTMWLASGHTVNVMLVLVDEFGLKTVSSTVVLVLVSLHISPDDLSSFLKLVSLSLSFARSNPLAFMFVFGFCPIKPIFYVII